MTKAKHILKEFIPPVIFSAIKKFKKPAKLLDGWSGNYSSWNEAKNHCTGYDSNSILEKCKHSLLKVKAGEAIYERDSVLFDEIDYSWPLLAALQRSALENNSSLCVLDFGGSFGSTYFQNKSFLPAFVDVSWHIVEQKNFVEEGKKFFQDGILKFFYNIEESQHHRQANIIIMSSVLQYLEFPYAVLADILKLGIPYIVIDRTAFVNNDTDILTVQDVPAEIYEASYPAWFFSIGSFIEKFHNYEIIASFNAHEGYVIHLENGTTATYKGFILRYKHDN